MRADLGRSIQVGGVWDRSLIAFGESISESLIGEKDKNGGKRGIKN